MAVISEKHLEAYFSYGLDIPHRRVWLTEDIDSTSISHVKKGLYLLDQRTSEAKKIEVVVSSYGGDEYEMFGLYDVLRYALKSPISTVAMGKCMSAAPLLVACGEPGMRWATPTTSFMVHEAWFHTEGRVKKVRAEVAHLERLEKIWLGLIAKHSKKTVAWWKKQTDRVEDFYFDAYQAQEWGLVDHIWDEKEGSEEG